VATRVFPPGRRAIHRVRELVPDNLPARLWLGQIYTHVRQPDRALETLRDPMAHPEKFSLGKPMKPS
jgi:thioredoxin-like negative regulator of GroEL